MELSKRLAAIAAMAEPGDRLADIGTDHGYLPIYLVEQNIAPSAIAMDVVEGPLARAFAHVREHGLEEKIVLRKSDGFEKLLPGEADAAVIAGMGGPLMIRILEEGKKTAESLKYLILSPQSDIPAVRRYLKSGGVFLCSGIIDDRAEEVAQGLRENGWEILETRQSEGWFSYLCR